MSGYLFMEVLFKIHLEIEVSRFELVIPDQWSSTTPR